MAALVVKMRFADKSIVVMLSSGEVPLRYIFNKHAL